MTSYLHLPPRMSPTAKTLDVRKPDHRPRSVLLASLIGTTIEFFDFYSYATASVLVFPSLFFPKSNPTTATLASFATFAIAFLARPIGSALFGHFGDKIGRRSTLVFALTMMGISTFIIGTLPTYSSIGIAAPFLLATCRCGQGLGLGGEWGGAVLLAVENAPESRRAWYGMFPQLGAPIGFFLSSSAFLLLSHFLTAGQFLRFGWRVPFLASALLVIVGLYVRLTIAETPQFQNVIDRREQVDMPLGRILRHHKAALAIGVLCCVATYVLFYLITVFALSWGTHQLHYNRDHFLLAQLAAILSCALAIPASALWAEKGRRRTLTWVTVWIAFFAIVFAPLLGGGMIGACVLMGVGQFLAGLSYGPLGTLVAELFPTPVRYTGSSLAFNLSGIVGASLAPSIAIWLATSHGLASVGYYLSASALLTLVGLQLVPRNENRGIHTGYSFTKVSSYE